MNKNIILILILFLIIIKSTSAELYKKDVTIQLNDVPREEVDRIFFSDSLLLNTEVVSSAEIIKQNAGSEIKYLSANLSFFPKETESQHVESMQSTPTFSLTGDSMTYSWNNPPATVGFNVKSQVRTRNVIVQIKEKVPFPIQDIPKEIEIYLKPSEKADINPKIVAQANDLAEGEDDLFQVAFNLAQWVKTNINYNLSTVTSEASQKASWVLDNRQGVCDEITVLFISMARSLGIPARFVSGISYTNSELFPERWGPHGWAEVYFPGHGWIPFDVTYGELGYVDASHVVSKIAPDPSDASVRYEWLGKDIDVQPGKINTKAQIISYGNPIVPSISIRVRPIFDNIGFGSYNLIQASVQNLQNHYIAADLFLNKVKDISILGDVEQPILLRPKETRNVFWTIRVDDDLDPNFIYDFPVAAYTYENIKAESSFGSSVEDEHHSKAEVDSLFANLLEEREKTYSKNVVLNCTSKKKQYYVESALSINCSIKNAGNTALNDLSLCTGVQCKSLDLGIAQQKYVVLSPSFKNPMETISIFLKGDEVTKVVSLPISILDRPKVEILDPSYPAEVRYEDAFQIRFAVKKTSKSSPENAKVVLWQNRIKTEWGLPEFGKDGEFVLDYAGSDLDFENRFNITVMYEDLDKNKYLESKTFDIRLKDLTLRQKIAVYINRIGRLFR